MSSTVQSSRTSRYELESVLSGADQFRFPATMNLQPPLQQTKTSTNGRRRNDRDGGGPRADHKAQSSKLSSTKSMQAGEAEILELYQLEIALRSIA